MRRLTKRASLQKPYHILSKTLSRGNQILSVKEMLDFCEGNIQKINFIHI